MRLWFGAALGALFLAGCGGAEGGAPPPNSASQSRYLGQAQLSHEVAAAQYSRQEATTPSPSMAGGYKPADARDMKSAPAPASAPQADNDADGIPDRTDLAAPEAPPPPAPPPGQAGQPTTGSTQIAANHDQTMLVYTANMTLAVYLVDQALNQVEAIARAHGGFLASRGDNQIIIRVPRSQFQATLGDVEKTGDVLHRDVRAEDVTDQFMDLEVRIKNARAIRDQLAALLVKANVKESIEIERELGRVTEQLELMEGQMKLLKDKIAYSTITVNYAARGATIQATSIRLPFPWLSQLGLPSLLRLEETK